MKTYKGCLLIFSLGCFESPQVPEYLIIFLYFVCTCIQCLILYRMKSYDSQQPLMIDFLFFHEQLVVEQLSLVSLTPGVWSSVGVQQRTGQHLNHGEKRDKFILFMIYIFIHIILFHWFFDLHHTCITRFLGSLWKRMQAKVSREEILKCVLTEKAKKRNRGVRLWLRELEEVL